MLCSCTHGKSMANFCWTTEKVFWWSKTGKIGSAHDRRQALYHQTFCLTVVEKLFQSPMSSLDFSNALTAPRSFSGKSLNACFWNALQCLPSRQTSTCQKIKNTPLFFCLCHFKICNFISMSQTRSGENVDNVVQKCSLTGNYR